MVFQILKILVAMMEMMNLGLTISAGHLPILDLIAEKEILMSRQVWMRFYLSTPRRCQVMLVAKRRR